MADAATRTGWTLQGWYTTTSGGTKVFNRDGSPVLGTSYVNSNGEWIYAGNVQLHAQWSINSYKYNIKFASQGASTGTTLTVSANNGGSVSGSPVSVNGTASVTAQYSTSNRITITVSAPTGYYVSTNQITSIGSLTNKVTISWTPSSSGSQNIYVLQRYTVSYNLNASSILSTPSGAPSATYKAHGIAGTVSSTKPTTIGYTFEGWNTSANGSGTPYASGGAISASTNSNLTLYAQWSANYYYIDINFRDPEGVQQWDGSAGVFDIVDEEWKNAVEGRMGRVKYSLITAPEYALTAAELFRRFFVCGSRRRGEYSPCCRKFFKKRWTARRGCGILVENNVSFAARQHGKTNNRLRYRR